MEETIVKKVSLEQVQKNMMDYFDTHDVKYVAEDATFIHLGTGEETKGREAIGGMLHYIYHVAFDARAEFVNHIITEKHAMVRPSCATTCWSWPISSTRPRSPW